MRTVTAGKVVLLAIGLAAGIAALTIAEEEKAKKDADVKVAWKDVPAAVQATIEKNLNGGTVTEVEKETEDGNEVYEAKVKGADGKFKEIEVAPDGKLVKIEADDDEGDAKAQKKQ